MVFILIVFALLILYKAKFFSIKQYNENYLSRENTTAIKGIFVFFIFLSHVKSYYYYSCFSIYDKPYLLLQNILGQLIVTMFFFYSGYGIMESFNKKGKSYIMQFPKNRILKTLIHFDIAVLVYFILDCLLGQKITIKNLLLALIGWDSIGNSNWFIFAILVLYIFVFISFAVFKNKKAAVCSVTLMTVLYILLIKEVKETWWYDTVLCLPAGMIFSLIKDKFKGFITKKPIVYLFSLAVLCAACASFYLIYQRSDIIWIYEIFAVAFCILVIVLSMKINLGNKFLNMLGNHVFSVYIFQRIPMILLKNIPFIYNRIWLFTLTAFVCTIVIAIVFDWLTNKADAVLFKVK